MSLNPTAVHYAGWRYDAYVPDEVRSTERNTPRLDIKGWPDGPRQLKKSKKQMVLAVLVDAVLLTVVCLSIGTIKYPP